MEVLGTALPEVKLVVPKVHGDARGFFVETWAASRYAAAGIGPHFVQDNLSRSARGTLRGLHLQHPRAQGKLVSVVEGSVIDVAVDVRVGSPRFGQHVAVPLSADDHRQLWVPPGFAHGFVVTSEHAIFAYKCTEPYAPECELGVLWSDPDLAIAWSIETPTLSARDRAMPRLRDIAIDRLPRFES
jgi:dTDP-4-dehydrorhamnose 3,5-epimerase